MASNGSPKSFRRGLGLALTATLMWGLLPVAMKGLLAAMEPYTLTWFRFSGSALLLALFVIPRRGFSCLKIPTLSLGGLMALAIAFLCANYILYVFGLDRLSPETTQVVIQLAPMFLLLGAMAVFGERFTLFQWVGFFLFTAGLVLFFNRRLGELVTSLSDYKIGVLLITVSAMMWAVYALAQKQLLKTLTVEGTLLWICIGGGLVFLPFSDPGSVCRLTPLHFVLLLFLALNTLVAYGCFIGALKHWEASRVSSVLTTVPIITLTSSALISRWVPEHFQAERLNVLSLLGALLVMGGSMAAALGSGKKR